MQAKVLDAQQLMQKMAEKRMANNKPAEVFKDG
jgi:hypothetical protein